MIAISILVPFFVICSGGISVAAAASNCPAACRCNSGGEKNWTVCEERNLEAIPTDMDPFTNLLDLSGNFLRIIPNNTFVDLGLIKLESVVMKRAAIVTIGPKAFANLTSLKVLDLSNNSIRFLDALTFSGLTSLIELNLANNSLTSIGSGWFFKSRSLQALSLSGNPLARFVDSPFINVPSLRILDLSNCTLLQVESQMFSDLMELNTLDLSRNALTTMPKDFFIWLRKLRRVRLDRNPWRCDCNIQVVTTVLILRGFSDSIDDLTCVYDLSPALRSDAYRWRDMNKSHVQEDCVPHIENHLKKVIMADSIDRRDKSIVFQFMNTTRTRISSRRFIDPVWTTAAIIIIFVCIACSVCVVYKLCARRRMRRRPFSGYCSGEEALMDGEKGKLNDHFYLGDDASSDMSVSADL